MISAAASEDEDLTKDTLLGGEVQLVQPKDGYRVAVDTVLLAAAVPEMKAGGAVLDLGTGVGGALLCYLHRVTDCAGLGVEISEQAAQIAAANLDANGWSERAKIQVGDIAAYKEILAKNSVDQVFANPPFHDGAATLSPDSDKARAMADAQTPLETWIEAMLWAVKPKGGLTLIHRADKVDAVLSALYGKAGAVEIFPIRPRDGALASRTILRARKAIRSPAKIHAGLSLHPDSGDGCGSRKYSDDALKVLEQGAPLF